MTITRHFYWIVPPSETYKPWVQCKAAVLEGKDATVTIAFKANDSPGMVIARMTKEEAMDLSYSLMKKASV